MGDIVSKEQRSKMMSSIRSISKLEDRVAKDLWNYGIRYRRSDKSLYGRPDISIKKYKLVIFIDSCFWHGCPFHASTPQGNREFWEKKLRRNIERDAEVTTFYNNRKWNILRIWEHDLKKDFHVTIVMIKEFFDRIKANCH